MGHCRRPLPMEGATTPAGLVKLMMMMMMMMMMSSQCLSRHISADFNLKSKTTALLLSKHSLCGTESYYYTDSLNIRSNVVRQDVRDRMPSPRTRHAAVFCSR